MPGNAVQQLGTLFHNGEVSREIGIEDIARTHGMQEGAEALDRCLLTGKTQLLSPGGAHGRSDLEHDDFVRVCHGVKDALGVVALTKSAHGTMGDALAARSAIDLGDGLAAAHVHRSMRGAIGKIPDPKPLNLLTHLDAAKAADALLVIANKRERAIPGVMFNMLLVRKPIDAQVVGYSLKSAVARTHAARTRGIVLGEQKLDIGHTRSTDFGGVRMDDHAIENNVVAGGNKVFGALDLNNANAATAHLV